MIPATFPEANTFFGPPQGLTESQVKSIPAYLGEAQGSLDGLQLAVVAWEPTPEELETIKNGGLIYLTCIGGLPPHFLSTNFAHAIITA